MSKIAQILNRIVAEKDKSEGSLGVYCTATYVLCMSCPGPTIKPIYVGSEQGTGTNFIDPTEAEANCRNNGGIAQTHYVWHPCDESPNWTEGLDPDELEGICDKKGRCCIGLDLQDGCDPISVGCSNLTAQECSDLGDAYEGSGVITYWVGDQGVFDEPSNCEDESYACFDEYYTNNNNPDNFQYCCVPGNPNPVEDYQGLEMTGCRCDKIGGFEIDVEDFREDICGNIVCPGSLESQNEVVSCCVKFNSGYQCVQINRCECSAGRIPGASSATVMENGCFDNPDYPKCNCCERNAQISQDSEIGEPIDDPPLKSV